MRLHLLPLILTVGCATPAASNHAVPSTDADARLEMTTAEELGVLWLVNHASFEELDDDVALDRRAAENIMAHRDGEDPYDAYDDTPFASLEELDAIPYVGPSALEKLFRYALDVGYVLDVPRDVWGNRFLVTDDCAWSHTNNGFVTTDPSRDREIMTELALEVVEGQPALVISELSSLDNVERSEVLPLDLILGPEGTGSRYMDWNTGYSLGAWRGEFLTASVSANAAHLEVALRVGDIRVSDGLDATTAHACSYRIDWAIQPDVVHGIEEYSSTAFGILNAANHASLEALDDVARLDVRAAENIVAWRNGEDGVEGTSDDNPFDTLVELDQVSWVGERAFSKLEAFACGEPGGCEN